MMTSAPSSVAFAPSLPAEALQRILSAPAVDTSTLCAAACVATAWRDAASAPALWSRLGPLRWRAEKRLTDARLAALAARSGSELRRVDLSGCSAVTDAGLEAALQPHAARLSHVSLVGCTALSTRGVERALRGAALQQLSVGGILPTPDADDSEACTQMLQPLLAPEVRAAWSLNQCLRESAAGVCHRICDANAPMCKECFSAACEACTPGLGFTECQGCGNTVCSGCIDTFLDRSTCYRCSFCGDVYCSDCSRHQPRHPCGGSCRQQACDNCATEQMRRATHGFAREHFHCNRCQYQLRNSYY